VSYVQGRGEFVDTIGTVGNENQQIAWM